MNIVLILFGIDSVYWINVYRFFLKLHFPCRLDLVCGVYWGRWIYPEPTSGVFSPAPRRHRQRRMNEFVRQVQKYGSYNLQSTFLTPHKQHPLQFTVHLANSS